MRTLTALMIFFSLSAISFAASAKDTTYQDSTEYKFDDDVVTGDLVRPDGADIIVRQRGKESSLIHVRQNFIPEMLKSVEDI